MFSRTTKDTCWHMAPNKAKALMLCKRQLPELVCDAANLEDINITLPEVQTLLEGITVGGHRIEEQEIVLNQANAWRALFSWVHNNEFELTQQKICELHKIAAKEESLTWGQFRSGSVTIAGTRYVPPNAEELPHCFQDMVNDSLQYEDIYDQAIFVFLAMAKNQFFYDVNKRMGRFAMNGVLLQAGFPAINVPAKKKLKFNQLMIAFYETGEHSAMNRFLRSCLDNRVIDIMKED